MKVVKGRFAEAKIFTDTVEETALEQVKSMVDHEMTEGAQVRLMSDIHAGKGSTIGTTIKLPADFADWKVGPNVVGVDVGCFSGDTKVSLADGRSISFLELIEEHEKGVVNYCYAIKDGEVSISEIEFPRKIKEVDFMYHIKLDNGEIIKATGDHLFHLRDGSKVRVDQISDGMSLMPLYLDKAKNVEAELNKNTRRKTQSMEETVFAERKTNRRA